MMKALQLQVESLTRQVERLGPENERVRKLLTEFDQRHDADQNQIAALSAALEAERERSHKFMWQVRDTCKRAESAEANLKDAGDVVMRLVLLYEGEHDPELVSRPDWIKDFLAKIKDKP